MSNSPSRLAVVAAMIIVFLGGCGEPKKGSVEYEKLFNDNLHQYAQKHPEDGEANFLYGLVSDDARESEQAWRDAIFHGYDNPAINTYLGLLYWGVLDKQNVPTDLEQAHYYLKKAVSQDTGNVVPSVLLKVLENGAENEAQKKYPKIDDLLPQTQYRYFSFYSKEMSKAAVCTLQRSGQLNSYNILELGIVTPFDDLISKMSGVAKAVTSDVQASPEDLRLFNQILENSLGNVDKLTFPDLVLRVTVFVKIIERGIATNLNKRDASATQHEIDVLDKAVKSFKDKFISMKNLESSIAGGVHTEADNPIWQSVLEIQKTCAH